MPPGAARTTSLRLWMGGYWSGWWHGGFFRPVLHYVLWKGIYTNKDTFFWNFFLKTGVRKNSHGISVVETCFKLSSTKVDACSVMNWAVVGQVPVGWQYLRAPTLDHCSLLQRSSSSVDSTIPSCPAGQLATAVSWYLLVPQTECFRPLSHHRANPGHAIL